MIKKYSNMIVLMVVLVLFLGGCGTTTTDIPTTTNATQEVANTTEETSTEDKTPEVSTEESSGAAETTVPNATIEQTNTESSQIGPQETTTTVSKTTTTTTTTFASTEVSASNTLKITGKVAFEMTITLDELKSLDDIMVEEEFYSKNNFGTAEHTQFKGINLWYLLKNYAGIDARASSVTVLAIDGYKVKFTIDQVMKQDYINESEPDKQLPMMIAWEENGIEYNSEDGPPYQLVVGQIGPGDFNKFQWVRNVDSIIVE